MLFCNGQGQNALLVSAITNNDAIIRNNFQIPMLSPRFYGFPDPRQPL